MRLAWWRPTEARRVGPPTRPAPVGGSAQLALGCIPLRVLALPASSQERFESKGTVLARALQEDTNAFLRDVHRAAGRYEGRLLGGRRALASARARLELRRVALLTRARVLDAAEFAPSVERQLRLAAVDLRILQDIATRQVTLPLAPWSHGKGVRAMEASLLFCELNAATNGVLVPRSATQGLPPSFIEQHLTKDGASVHIAKGDLSFVLRSLERETDQRAVWQAFAKIDAQKAAANLDQAQASYEDDRRVRGQSDSARLFKSWNLGGGFFSRRGPAAARRFLSRVQELALGPAHSWERELLELKRQHLEPGARRILPWELPRLEAMRRDRLPRLEALAPYLDPKRVEAHALEEVGALFGLDVRRASSPPGLPASVSTFEVRAGRHLLGRIVLDLEARDGLPAWDSSARIAEAPRTIWVRASLDQYPGDRGPWLDPVQVPVLFHELGHAVQQLVERHDDWGVLSELPSQLLELWAFQPETMRRLFRDELGRPLPASLCDDWRQWLRQNPRAMNEAAREGAFAIELHESDPKGHAIERLVRSHCEDGGSLVPWVAERTHQVVGDTNLERLGAGAGAYSLSRPIAHAFVERMQREPDGGKKLARRMLTELYPELERPNFDPGRAIERVLGERFSFRAFERALADPNAML